MTYETALQTIGSWYTQTTILDTNWILAAIVTLITLILVSKRPQDWIEILLPTTILWHIMGLTPSFIQYTIAVILFVSNIFSRHDIMNIIDTRTKPSQSITDAIASKQSKKYSEMALVDLKKLHTRGKLDKLITKLTPKASGGTTIKTLSTGDLAIQEAIQNQRGNNKSYKLSTNQLNEDLQKIQYPQNIESLSLKELKAIIRSKKYKQKWWRKDEN